MKKKNLIKNVILYFKFVLIVINLFLKYFEYNYNCKKIKNGLPYMTRLYLSRNQFSKKTFILMLKFSLNSTLILKIK